MLDSSILNKTLKYLKKEILKIINHYLSELNLKANILPIIIPIPSAITSSALENLLGTNDCHISSKTAKHKQIIEILIIFLIDLLLKLLTLKNPNIEYSII